MLLLRGIQGASKNPLPSFQLHEVLNLWLRQVSVFQWKVHKKADQKKPTISRDFGTFSNFDVFCEEETQGHLKPQVGHPK